jgi:predicted DNA-binding protein
MEPMKNLLIKFPEKLLDDLASLAKQLGVPRAEIIREWAECSLRIGPDRLKVLREHAGTEGVLLSRIVGEAIDIYIREKKLEVRGTSKASRSKQ